MTEIDVPDWVVEAGAKAILAIANPKCVGELAAYQFAEDALTAALGAWVVPTKFQSRERFMGSDWSLWRTFDYPHDRDSDFDRMNNADGWQSERRDLYTLRQEKPDVLP